MKKQEEKKRLSLADFNFKGKHAAGVQMPILLPSGQDSGEWLTVRGPECDESQMAQREYTRLLFALEDELAPLKAESEVKQNFFDYNNKKSDATKELNAAFVCDVVVGWSLTEEFSKEELLNLLDGFPALMDQVSAFHGKLTTDLEAK